MTLETLGFVIAGIALALAALTEVLRRRGEKRHSAEEKRHSAELRGLTDQLAAETARNEKSSRASEESSRAQSAAIEKLTRDNIELMHSLPLRPTPAPTGRRRVLGREHDIEALTATLLGDNPTVILWGERGIGKTQLAIALAGAPSPAATARSKYSPKAVSNANVVAASSERPVSLT